MIEADLALLEVYGLKPAHVDPDFSARLSQEVDALEKEVAETGLREFLRHLSVRQMLADRELSDALKAAQEANEMLAGVMRPAGTTIH
jgi:hypothetical protein